MGAWFQAHRWPIRLPGLLLAPILAGIAGDFFYYWFHRLQHTCPWLCRFHAVHHSLREMSALNSNHHVTEEIFRIPVVTVPASLVGVSAGPVLPLVAVLLGMQGLYEHSCTRLHCGWGRYLLADNRFHRIHHSLDPRHWGKNFGSFSSVWDLVFGTAYFPKAGEWPETGLADLPEPQRLSEFMFTPERPSR